MRVLLADDHVIVRQGLKSLLSEDPVQAQVVAEASDGYEAVRLAAEHQPEVAILDYSMPLMNGLDATREVLRVSPKTKVVLLTMFTEDQYVLESLRAGVRAYVLKSQAADDLKHALREVQRGGIYVSPRVSQAVVQAYLQKTDVPTDLLTPRERQVLQLVAEGKSTKEVAGILGLSVKTAEAHRMRVMKKLDIHETASLTRYAIKRGLVQP